MFLLCHHQDGGEGCETFGEVTEPMAIGELVLNDVVAEAGAPLLASEHLLGYPTVLCVVTRNEAIQTSKKSQEEATCSIWSGSIGW